MLRFEPVVPGIYLLRTPFGANWSGVYLVKGSGREDTILIDSGSGDNIVDEAVVPALGAMGMNLKDIGWLTCTHCHGDHIGGHKRLVQRGEMKTAVYEGSAEKIRDPYEYGRRIRTRFPEDSPAPAGELCGILPDKLIADGGRIGGRLRLIAASGHDSDSVCFLDERTNTLLTGDSVQGLGAAGSGLAFYQDVGLYQSSISRLLQEQADQLGAAHDYAPVGAVVSGRKNVEEYLKLCLGVSERYHRILSKWKQEEPKLGIKEAALRLIREEGRTAPGYLFLEMYTVSAHFRAIQGNMEMNREGEGI